MQYPHAALKLKFFDKKRMLEIQKMSAVLPRAETSATLKCAKDHVATQLILSAIKSREVLEATSHDDRFLLYSFSCRGSELRSTRTAMGKLFHSMTSHLCVL